MGAGQLHQRSIYLPPPFGTITEGMEAVQAINAEYQQEPSQQQIGLKGNKYLNKLFPYLDYIKSAYILE